MAINCEIAQFYLKSIKSPLCRIASQPSIQFCFEIDTIYRVSVICDKQNVLEY